MRGTHNAPTIKKIPARTSIITCEASPPSGVNKDKMGPPATAATICGKQIVQLNSPKNVPIRGLP